MTSGRIGNTFIAASLLSIIPAIAFAQLPNGLKTTGAKTKANQTQVCAADYIASVEPVKAWQRSQALANYGRRDDDTGALDHLIPLGLGGSNEPDNLWPQPDNKEMGIAAKDELEAKLRTLVCDSKTMSLKDAQDAIRKNWIKAYDKYVKNAN
jgi:hypothetical protein